MVNGQCLSYYGATILITIIRIDNQAIFQSDFDKNIQWNGTDCFRLV